MNETHLVFSWFWPSYLALRWPVPSPAPHPYSAFTTGFQTYFLCVILTGYQWKSSGSKLSFCERGNGHSQESPFQDCPTADLGQEFRSGNSFGAPHFSRLGLCFLFLLVVVSPPLQLFKLLLGDWYRVMVLWDPSQDRWWRSLPSIGPPIKICP